MLKVVLAGGVLIPGDIVDIELMGKEESCFVDAGPRSIYRTTMTSELFLGTDPSVLDGSPVISLN